MAKKAKATQRAVKRTAQKSGKRAAKKAAKTAAKRASGRRERVDNRAGAFFGKRDVEGQFTEMDEVGRSLPADRRRKAGQRGRPGFGDQGDR